MEISQLLGQTLVSATQNGYRISLRFSSRDVITINQTTTFDSDGNFVDLRDMLARAKA